MTKVYTINMVISEYANKDFIIVVKREVRFSRNVIQQRYRKSNPREVRDTNKRIYLTKKAERYGKPYTIVDSWMREWWRTGKVVYE